MLKKPASSHADGFVGSKIGRAARGVSLSRRNNIFVKRIYEDRSPDDGCRILVDRLWPRGIKKEQAHIDLWLKEIAPSHELRSWFQHDPAKWEMFKERYFRELNTHEEQIVMLGKKMRDGPLTLLYAAKNETCNHAVALKDYLVKASK